MKPIMTVKWSILRLSSGTYCDCPAERRIVVDEVRYDGMILFQNVCLCCQQTTQESMQLMNKNFLEKEHSAAFQLLIFFVLILRYILLSIKLFVAFVHLITSREDRYLCSIV